VPIAHEATQSDLGDAHQVENSSRGAFGGEAIPCGLYVTAGSWKLVFDRVVKQSIFFGKFEAI
jgi:hypothetical protein